MIKLHNNNEKIRAGRLLTGFTLIELLMVISIITLLSSMFLSYVGSARAKTRDTIRLSDMKQINTATNLFYEDRGILPSSIGGNESTSLVSAGYLPTEPKDPKTGASYKFSKVRVVGTNKEIVVVNATYENIYRTDNKPQQVGVVVGDVDMSNICNLITQFENTFGTKVDMTFPICDSNEVSDHIFGVTSGRRRGGGGSSGTGGNESVTCNSFTYSGWSACNGGTQTRTVSTSSPIGCTGGSPELSQSCVENICTSFTYSGWSSCIDGIQSRTYIGIPAGCTGGNPVFSHSCDGSLQWSVDLGLMSWYSAKDFCENPANGYTKLPTKEELHAALTDQFINGGNNPGGFTYREFYWSSTETNQDVVNVAACTLPNTVISNYVNDKIDDYIVRARCVR
jgi:prepilin-type N-terminal cleavage/methylation domain-containing protein